MRSIDDGEYLTELLGGVIRELVLDMAGFGLDAWQERRLAVAVLDALAEAKAEV